MSRRECRVFPQFRSFGSQLRRLQSPLPHSSRQPIDLRTSGDGSPRVVRSGRRSYLVRRRRNGSVEGYIGDCADRLAFKIAAYERDSQRSTLLTDPTLRPELVKNQLNGLTLGILDNAAYKRRELGFRKADIRNKEISSPRAESRRIDTTLQGFAQRELSGATKWTR
jgi:hypothetical protein